MPPRRQPVPARQQTRTRHRAGPRAAPPQRLHPRRRQLNRQRHPVQPRHHWPGLARQGKPRIGLAYPVREQRHRLGPARRVTVTGQGQRPQPEPRLTSVCSGSRLVASTRTSSHAPSSPAHSSAAAPIRCSQLPAPAAAAGGPAPAPAPRPPGAPGCSCTPAPRPPPPRPAPGRSPGQLGQPRPSANRAATARATRLASRVLPTPPGPVTVTSRCRPSRSATSRTYSSRPTKLVSSAGKPCTPPAAVSAADTPRPYHNRRPHIPYRPQRRHTGTQRKRHSVSPLPALRRGQRPHLGLICLHAPTSTTSPGRRPVGWRPVTASERWRPSRRFAAEARSSGGTARLTRGQIRGSLPGVVTVRAGAGSGCRGRRPVA